MYKYIFFFANAENICDAQSADPDPDLDPDPNFDPDPFKRESAWAKQDLQDWVDFVCFFLKVCYKDDIIWKDKDPDPLEGMAPKMKMADWDPDIFFKVKLLF